MAVEEATSPAAWPPMPSATAYRPGDDQELVLVVRADKADVGGRPDDELAHLLQLQHGPAHLHAVTPAQRARRRSPCAR